ncbi:MAG: hypothetical protein E6Q67_02010 [Roseateles sp.]|nr:MAG: hypothetical protein E6Q67_02010 [Roseateles sp.]
MNYLFRRLAPAAVLCIPVLALAQAGKADPADARSPGPALHYQSAFADYRPWQDAKPGDWRALNDNLRPEAAGGAGHGGHTMPGMPAAASAPTPSASQPIAPAHGVHRMHGGKP